MSDLLGDHSFETQFQENPEKFHGISPQEIPQNFSGNLKNSWDLVPMIAYF